MEGFKIDINDILRFTGVGIFILLIFGYENASLFSKIKDMGAVSMVVIAFLGGTIVYNCYRTLIYGTLIIRLKDTFFKDQKFYSRSYLIAKIGCKSTKEANAFYYYLRGIKSLKALAKESSSVHLMYMTSIILLFYAVYKVTDWHLLQASELLLFSFIIFAGGFLSDRNVEKYDYQQLRAIEREELQYEWEKFNALQDD
ncbi:MAG TPA: hypothetical protein VF679_13295 [Pedobacter sp.]